MPGFSSSGTTCKIHMNVAIDLITSYSLRFELRLLQKIL